MNLILCAAALAAGLAQSGPSRNAPKESILWASTWEEAVKEATIRNCPIFFTAHKDG